MAARAKEKYAPPAAALACGPAGQAHTALAPPTFMRIRKEFYSDQEAASQEAGFATNRLRNRLRPRTFTVLAVGKDLKYR